MKRRLFLTGPIGCGKSTAITQVLGEGITQRGGFLTRRYREPHLHFTLESPDGQYSETFLDFPDGKPKLLRNVFSQLGVDLLKGDILVLDEIGGIELLDPNFTAALDDILNSSVPILGVIKGDGSAGALVEALGLTEEYECAVSRLREQLCSDIDTLVYACEQYDEEARHLTKQWAEEYLHD